jgi:hypothetical protein
MRILKYREFLNESVSFVSTSSGIKSGIKELFKSNNNLVNNVYENLDFDIDKDISIRFGRSAKMDGYTVQNVIVNYKGKDITGQKPKTNLEDEDLGNYGEGDAGGFLYLILPDNEDIVYVGNVSIPKELRSKGIGKKIYQKISNLFQKPIRSSIEFKFPGGSSTGQSEMGKNFWKNKKEIEPQIALNKNKL